MPPGNVALAELEPPRCPGSTYTWQICLFSLPVLPVEASS